MKTPKIFHHYLIAIFPILFLFVHNRGWFNGYQEIAYLLALASGSAALLHLLFTFILKDQKKSALLVSLIAVLFFTYGHLYETAYAHAWSFFPVSRHPYLLATYGLLFLVGAYIILRTQKNFENITSFLNITGLVLVLFSFGNLLTYSAPETISATPPKPQKEILVSTSDEQPDIYYIILDSYQGASELRDYYGFDNTPFLSSLEERGFHIVEKSLSNYGGTTLSLPSSLNMDYLHSYWKDRETPVTIEELTPATRNNAVLQFLDSKNYTTTHIGHWNLPTFRNEFADISYEVGRFGDAFTQLVVRTTILSPFMQSVFSTNIHHEVLEAFSILEGTTKIPSPKFVFAHIISPHSDYVFGPNGEERVHRYDLPPDEYKTWAKGAYLDQLQFVNTRTLEVLDTILANNADPIIVIQSDHGNGDTVKTNYRNLTAIRASNHKEIGIYDTVTPVNIFRLIFNAYFDEDYEILPDRAYELPGSDNNGYDIGHPIDITDQVKFE